MTSCQIGQILRERNLPFSRSVLRSNINQPGPEALGQAISKRGHLPGPDPSEHKLLTGAAGGDPHQGGPQRG